MYRYDDHPRLRELLLLAAEKPAADRASFVAGAGVDDPGLRAELASLVAALGEAEEFAPDPTLPRPSDPAPPELGTKIGRYTLVDLIGEGGFGSVFLARQDRPVRRDVALKVIKLGMDTRQVIARFDAERQALAMMDHPGSARVLDAGATDAGRPYFVMDFVDGVRITEYCDANGLTTRQRLELFVHVCQAVQHAHTKGIIHRDLKPSNVLVMQLDGAPVPKVIDFGIAKATQAKLTEHTLLTEKRLWMGTPQYMSPEQADGGSTDIDTRSDVYSLGALLYELLTGATPFDFRTAGYEEVQRIILHIDPPLPSVRLTLSRSKSKSIDTGVEAGARQRAADGRLLRRELKGDLDRIVLKAMEKDRTRRYETAHGLSVDIQRHLRHEPVTARHPGTIYRFRKLVRRNTLAFAGASAFVLTLVISLVASTWLYLRESRARDRADLAEINARNAQSAESVLRDNAEAKAYASDMNLVQQSLAANNFRRARELLDRYRARPGETDRRGWEWRYLWQQCRSDLVATICQRPNGIASLSVSHEGQWIAVAERGGKISIWDRHARTEIPAPETGDADVRLAFSPCEPLLAYITTTFDSAGRPQGEAHLWDVGKGKVVATAELADLCQGLAFSQGGKTLAISTGKAHGRLTLWRVPNLMELSGLSVPNADYSTSSLFAAAPGLSSAAIAPEDQVWVVDLSTGKNWSEHVDAAPTSVAFSPNGRVLAFGQGAVAPTVQLRDAATGNTLGPPLEGHLASVTDLVFWPDGKTLASAGADQTIRLWDVSDPGHAKPIGRPLRSREEIWRLALLPDNQTLVSGAKDGSVSLWDVSRVRQERTEHLRFAAIGWEWDTTDSSGAVVVSVDRDGRVVWHDCARMLDISKSMDIHMKVDGVDFFGGRLLLVASGGTLSLWDLNRKILLSQHPKFDNNIWYSAWTPHGHWISSVNDTVRDWDALAETPLPPPRVPGGVNAMAFTADGRRQLAIGYRGFGVLTDTVNGAHTNVKLGMSGVVDACFSADGSLLAVASETGFVGIWRGAALDAGGNVPPMAKLSGFTLSPHSLAFSPDVRRLAVGGQGSEAVKLFDAGSRQEVLTFGANGSAFDRTRFSPDGNVLAASNGASELHLWRAPTWAEIDAAEAKDRAGSTQ